MSFAASFNVRDFGAVGDGVTLDSPAINAAIDAANAAGGGTVILPAGTYLSFTVRLHDRVVLHLGSGATLLAASPSIELGSYDQPELNAWGDELQYQDFGHSHWRNSLIWGDGLVDIGITGPGLIDGQGLLRHATYTTAAGDPGPNGTAEPGTKVTLSSGHGDTIANPLGHGNKAIGLRNCRNVLLRGFSLHRGGHFALLATGLTHLTVDNVRFDTNRDGLDIDCCRNVRISNCTINTPMDDAIVLKSSYALGEKRACEDITISDCLVSGFDVGSVLDGTFGTTTKFAPDRDGPTGRIKIGTESHGDFRNITVTNCLFRRSRGLALETVDGAIIEDVVVSNITMQEVTNSPIFLRIGNRARGPVGTAVGALRRIRISGVSVNHSDGRFPILLVGMVGHPLEDITLEGIRIVSAGGITLAEVAAQPDHLVNRFFLRSDEPGVTGPRDPLAVPERDRAYPEPSMFGLLPASALYARHVHGLTVNDVHTTFTTPDERPLVVQDDVTALTITDSNLF